MAVKQSIESIGVDLKGRVKSVKLAYSNCLLPLFEAIINSIDAIQDAKNGNGEISIHIERDKQLNTNNSQPYFEPIIGFKIVDNGIGFNNENYSSFKRDHSTHKEERGAKGIGRFLWLKAFNRVNVESYYQEDSKSYKRSFDFTLNKGISHNIPQEAQKNGYSTIIQLLSLKPEFQEYCPKKPSTIANKIIEHCLIYFLSDKCPEMILFNDDGEEFNLNEYFENTIERTKKTESFKVDNYKFNLTILKVANHDEINSNILHYCAHKRQVESLSLRDIIPEFSTKIYDEELQKDYYIVCYLESKYFNTNLNDERTEIIFAKKRGLKFAQIYEDDLYLNLSKELKKHFEKIIAKYKEEKISRLSEFISTKSPQYKHIFKHPDLLDDIQYSSHSSDLDIELKLFKVSQKIELENRISLSEFSDKLINDDGFDFNTKKEELIRVIEETNDIGNSKLIQYVIHRKLILDLFGKTLKYNSESKYSLEDSVHDIIFPLKSTSDEIDYEKHNLWILDEKLSYHSYIASDKPLNPLKSKGDTDRPDILIFDNPSAFRESNSLDSVIIIEFKRPMRKAYNEEDQPLEQVYRYLKKIRENKAVDNSGRPFEVNENTRFYLYIICDFTDKIRSYAENASLIKAPENNAYFGYNPNHKAYIELMSYNKLYDIAKKRNKILFDKLGLISNNED